MFDLMTRDILSQDNNVITGPNPEFCINEKQYAIWQKSYTFDALQHGIRFGQSFCNYFNITDYILYYTLLDVDRADEYIRKNYIR